MSEFDPDGLIGKDVLSLPPDESRFNPVKSSSPSQVFQIGETAREAGVWAVLDTALTAVFPAGEEPDPALVKQCREYDPHFVPLWCRKVFRSPANTDTVTGHYVIGRYVPPENLKSSKDNKPPVVLESWPSDFPFDPKEVYEVHAWTLKWPKGSYGLKLCMPEPGKPFDNRLVDYVRLQSHVHANFCVEDALRSLQEMADEEKAELRKIMEDAEYQLKQDWRGMKKAIEEERWGPTATDTTPKPMVYLKDLAL